MARFRNLEYPSNTFKEPFTDWTYTELLAHDRLMKMMNMKPSEDKKALAAFHAHMVYAADILTIPSVPVSTAEGIKTVRDVVERRMNGANLFESSELFSRFCLLSGGHFRSLFTLIRSALERTETLPITERVAERTFRRAANDLVLGLRQEDWEILDKVNKNTRPGQRSAFRHPDA